MRKIIAVFVFLALVSFASSIEINNMKISYNQYETMIIKISGVFLEPLSKNNFFIYKYGHVPIVVIKELAVIDGDYYLYALLPKEENNYTMKIENIRYMVGRDVSEEVIEKNFTITNKLSDFTINPGFMITSQNFNINLQNNIDKNIVININFNSKSQDYNLKTGETKKITVDISDINQAKTFNLKANAESTNYEIPIQVIPNQTEINKTVMKFSQEKFGREVLVEDYKNFTIYLYNLEDYNLTNVNIEIPSDFEDILTIDNNFIKNFRANSLEKIILSFYSKDKGEFSGFLTATDENNENASMLMDILFVNKINETVNNETSENCYKLGGEICYYYETCNGNIKNLENADCCLGNCIIKNNTNPGSSSGNGEKPSLSFGKIMGWVLLIAVVGFLAWFFYFKNKKPKIKTDVERTLEKSDNIFKRKYASGS